MLLIYYYVPTEHAEAVKQAVFAAGAGRIGNYEQCCWQTAGQGQFRPLQGSEPFSGVEGELSVVEEIKVEMICAAKLKSCVEAALLQAHPYEEVAYGFVKLEN